jgi:hypothetical protein
VCGGKVDDIKADVVSERLIGSGQVKMKSRHDRPPANAPMGRLRAESGQRWSATIDFVLNVDTSNLLRDAPVPPRQSDGEPPESESLRDDTQAAACNTVPNLGLGMTCAKTDPAIRGSRPTATCAI